MFFNYIFRRNNLRFLKKDLTTAKKKKTRIIFSSDFLIRRIRFFMKSEREKIRNGFMSCLSSRPGTRDPGVIKVVLPFISSPRSVGMRGIKSL